MEIIIIKISNVFVILIADCNKVNFRYKMVLIYKFKIWIVFKDSSCISLFEHA